MREQSATGNPSGQQKPWLIVLVASVFLLAVIWSIDSFFVYVLLGVASFSLFKIFQLRPRQQHEYQRQQSSSYTGTPYERQFRPSFWDQVKYKFSNPTTGSRAASSPASSLKVIRIILAVFTGLIFLSILIPIFSSDDSIEAEQRATAFYDNQQYDSAAYYYRIAIANDPDNADLYLKRGHSFLYANRNDSASVLYDQAIMANPGNEEAYYYKGWILFNSSRYREALQQGRKSLAVNPDYDNALLLLGDCYYNMNESDSAIIAYERVYSTGYRSAPLSNMMAYLYDRKGETARAIELYKEAVSYDTTLTDVYRRLGEIVQGEEGNSYRQKAAKYPVK